MLTKHVAQAFRDAALHGDAPEQPRRYMMSHSQQFRNRRCSCQIGFGVRMGLGTPSFSPDLCSRFAACWMMLVFVLVPHKFLSVACGCACEALAFPAPWRTFCSTACTCQSVGLVGAADVCLH